MQEMQELQVKLFVGHSVERAEQEINEWLATNPGNVKRVTPFAWNDGQPGFLFLFEPARERPTPSFVPQSRAAPSRG